MKFKHKVTGIVEDVTNETLIPQYLKHKDTYVQVRCKVEGDAEDKTEDKPKAARSKSK